MSEDSDLPQTRKALRNYIKALKLKALDSDQFNDAERQALKNRAEELRELLIEIASEEFNSTSSEVLSVTSDLKDAIATAKDELDSLDAFSAKLETASVVFGLADKLLHLAIPGD